MSSKRRTKLPTIPEVYSEPSPTIVSLAYYCCSFYWSCPKASAGLAGFIFDIQDTESTLVSKASRLCIRRDTGAKYVINRTRATTGGPTIERTILEAVTNMNAPFVSHLLWAFHEGGQIYLITVGVPVLFGIDLISPPGLLPKWKPTWPRKAKWVSGISSSKLLRFWDGE